MEQKEIFDLLGNPIEVSKSYCAYYLGKPKGTIKPREPIFLIAEFKNDKSTKLYINHNPLLKQ